MKRQLFRRTAAILLAGMAIALTGCKTAPAYDGENVVRVYVAHNAKQYNVFAVVRISGTHRH